MGEGEGHSGLGGRVQGEHWSRAIEVQFGRAQEKCSGHSAMVVAIEVQFGRAQERSAW